MNTGPPRTWKKLTRVQVPVAELTLGMHVIELDRPWLETDFLMQGFIIHHQSEIDSLRQQCLHVYIEGVEHTLERRTEKRGLFARMTGRDQSKATSTEQIPPAQAAGRPIVSKRTVYINKINLHDEIRTAKDGYSAAKSVAKNIMDDIRIGRMLDMNQVRTTVDDVVESLLRNDDALLWLTKIKNQDEYTAEHSLNVCILSVAFARHLGHSKSEIRKIGLAGLLHDVGKSKIPIEILNKPGRMTLAEFTLIKQHPALGRNLLMSVAMSEHSAIDVAYSHHERIDGNGYPRGLQAHQIPYYAKLVALTDAYDAITSARCYDAGRASMEALDIIYKCKGSQFDDELAIEFIRCVGIYPPGSIVEMTNGEVGVVTESNKDSKLKPKVMLVKDHNKEWQAKRSIDLCLEHVDQHGQRYIIAREVPNKTFDIDIKEFLQLGLLEF